MPATATLTLPKPAWGNARRLESHMVVRETLGKEPIVIDGWLEMERLAYQYDNLTWTEKEDLLTYLFAHAGELYQFTDYDGAIFNGIILTDQIEVKQVALPVGNCPIAVGGNPVTPDRGLFSLGFEIGIVP